MIKRMIPVSHRFSVDSRRPNLTSKYTTSQLKKKERNTANAQT